MFSRVMYTYITLHYKAHLLRAAFHLLPACGAAFHNSMGVYDTSAMERMQ